MLNKNGKNGHSYFVPSLLQYYIYNFFIDAIYYNEFSFRCVENEVSVRHQDRAALQEVEESSGDQWEVWAEDRKLWTLGMQVAIEIIGVMRLFMESL